MDAVMTAWPGVSDAWWILGAWLVVTLAYALWRSRGKAPTDPIRPSGPVF